MTVRLAGRLCGMALLLAVWSGSSGCGDDGDGGPADGEGEGEGGEGEGEGEGGEGEGEGEGEGGDPALVRINEIVHKAVDAGPDWIELYNAGAGAVALQGWQLQDDDDLHTFVFPAGVRLPAQGFLLIEGPGGSGELLLSFGLGRADAVRLRDASATLIDRVDWVEGDAPLGSSFGRYPDGQGDPLTLPTPTPGQANVAPAAEP